MEKRLLLRNTRYPTFFGEVKVIEQIKNLYKLQFEGDDSAGWYERKGNTFTGNGSSYELVIDFGDNTMIINIGSPEAPVLVVLDIHRNRWRFIDPDKINSFDLNEIELEALRDMQNQLKKEADARQILKQALIFPSMFSTKHPTDGTIYIRRTGNTAYVLHPNGVFETRRDFIVAAVDFTINLPAVVPEDDADEIMEIVTDAMKDIAEVLAEIGHGFVGGNILVAAEGDEDESP